VQPLSSLYTANGKPTLQT